jgi:nucleoside transporter
MGTKVRLGIMMFLQYAIWGAWYPVLSEYLRTNLSFSGTEVGVIYSLLPLATIIAPFIGGQFADRYFNSQTVIAFLQLIGGILLIIVSRLADYSLMMWLMLVYCLFYAPTMALTNSVAMINLKKSEEEFGRIRVWGTIGWIAAGWVLTGMRYIVGEDLMGDMLLLAGIFSIIMGFQAFTLPHTPPRKEGTNPLAFLDALKMMRDKNFLIFIIICFVVATELMFYYALTGPFLVDIGILTKNLPAVMSVAQLAEILVMAFLLPIMIKKYSIRTTLVWGVIAWPVRYIIFAIGEPTWLVVTSLALHGFCFVFFFVAAFIYVDQVAPRDIRHSAQSFITLVTYGLGMYVGSLFAGWIQSFFTQNAITNWTNVFLVPCVLTVLCALAFLLFFRSEEKPKAAEAAT